MHFFLFFVVAAALRLCYFVRLGIFGGVCYWQYIWYAFSASSRKS